MELIDILIEQKKKNEKFFANPLEYAKKIKLESEKIFGIGKVKVYLFGSVASGRASASSDIDILVIAPPIMPDKRGEILARLKMTVGMTSPFEIHLITEKQYAMWYKKFISSCDKIAV